MTRYRLLGTFSPSRLRPRPCESLDSTTLTAGTHAPLEASVQLHPGFEEFRALAAGAGVVPVWREFLFDVDAIRAHWVELRLGPAAFQNPVVGDHRV